MVLKFMLKFRMNARYKCDVCEKSYNHKSSLERHKRRHTGDSPSSPFPFIVRTIKLIRRASVQVPEVWSRVFVMGRVELS